MAVHYEGPMNLIDGKIGNLTEIGSEMVAGRLIRNGEQTQIGAAC
jgi:hypothetical protein